ncbi:2-amino-4-hydroxy-6-hydroxymethyldihydropteridine diphosphokinase [uncultured Prevotella sp.]|uniref:2-amino-4-hydroxy-6- hydroxymethyldihydropteridine diphosphokinase n=1 Tax=uncultured Prevotella sp. TaxID=159272 RepID=UPI00261A9CA0|nr:2-amino-4-hydroxy-6-hydroxymethyldihydropteridine diphosphokinase [uncultured Prevotella sp.]
MTKQNYIIISIGSNYNQKENISFAKKKLTGMLGEQTSFTRDMWTEPVGIQSEKFINCICISSTKHTLLQLTKAFKQLERKCERSKKNDLINKIPLDIDILLYGDQRYHEKDWERQYIQELLNDFFDKKGNFVIDPTIL